jgi:membrane-associated phospholipid phosphatase
VSVSRLGARRHWISDIFVGGSTGFLIGRYIYKRYHDPSLPGSPVQRNGFSRLVPDVGFGMRGPALTWAW